MNRGSALMRGVVSFGPFRLFPHGLLGQAESDHVCNDHVSARRVPLDAFMAFPLTQRRSQPGH